MLAMVMYTGCDSNYAMCASERAKKCKQRTKRCRLCTYTHVHACRQKLEMVLIPHNEGDAQTGAASSGHVLFRWVFGCVCNVRETHMKGHTHKSSPHFVQELQRHQRRKKKERSRGGGGGLGLLCCCLTLLRTSSVGWIWVGG